MKYVAKKMGELAFKVPDAYFETWDGKIIRTTPEFCWAIGMHIGEIVTWARKHSWMLKITSDVNLPPLTAHKVNVKCKL